MDTAPHATFGRFSELPATVQSAVLARLDLPSAAAASAASSALRGVATQALWRRYCCAACRHAVFHPRDIDGAAPQMRLLAEAALCVREPEGIQEARYALKLGTAVCAQLYGRFDIRAAADAAFAIGLVPLLCGGCGVFLGCRFLGLPDDDDCADAEEALIGRIYFCPRLLLLAKWSREAAVEEKPQAVVGGAHAEPNGDVMLRCQGRGGSCGAPLAEASQVVLGQQWDLVGRGAEETGLVLALLRPDVLTRCSDPPWEVEVPQGAMRVAAVGCAACGLRLGWRIVAIVRPAVGEELTCALYEGRHALTLAAMAYPGAS
eukprot:jgi/Tetstr1/438887/TSEL_027395.t1